MPNITCPHCQREFYMANQLEETRHLEFDQLRRSVDDLAKRNKLGLAKTDELEDRIYELEHSERLSNRLVNLESEVDALRSLVNDEIDGLRSRLYGLESEVASGRAFPRANEEELEELRGREESTWPIDMTELDRALKEAWQEIEWLKERVEDIERAAAEQKSHINALHLSREQGQVAEAQALSPEQIEKVLRDTAEKKTINIADLKKLGESELRERIEKLEKALNDVSEEDQERIATLEGRVKQIENSHWGDKASAVREEAIEDRVEKLEQEQTQYPPEWLSLRIKTLERNHERHEQEKLKQHQNRVQTTRQKLNFIIETMLPGFESWTGMLRWLNTHPDIDQAYEEAQREHNEGGTIAT